MRPIVRSFLIPVVAAALFMVAGARPAAAQAAQCLVGEGVLASGASISVTAPPGHTYIFSYTGAATGTITVAAGTTLNIVNGTGGDLNYQIFDQDCAPPIPTLSGWMLALMALILAGVGVLFMQLRR